MYYINDNSLTQDSNIEDENSIPQVKQIWQTNIEIENKALNLEQIKIDMCFICCKNGCINTFLLLEILQKWENYFHNNNEYSKRLLWNWVRSYLDRPWKILYLELLWNYYSIVTPAGKWSTRPEEAVSSYVAIRPGVRPLGSRNWHHSWWKECREAELDHISIDHERSYRNPIESLNSVTSVVKLS